MVRWHQTSCATPDVSAEGEGDTLTLRCRNCDIAVLARNLIAQQASRFSPLAIPQDEPAEQMDLWWPPGVPYSQDSRESHAEPPSGSTAAALAMEDKDHLMEDSVSSGLGNLELSKALPDDGDSHTSETPPEFPPGNLYGATLGIDEFRLLCLYAGEDVGSLIHVTLEVFRHDDCPEYETVSYTWGGEDGDSTPCRPIFVGTYWDILLQTKNCWDMLHYMRPWRGIRMVWVDAICINQANTVERTHQVAKMGNIYQSCSRVIVYLGPDIVSTKGSNRRHPSRLGLHEFNKVMKGNTTPKGARKITLQELLTRRYFSRVWVIQELILSQYVIIPVGYVQFSASSLTPGLCSLDWDSSAVPWMQYMGGISFGEDDLYQILRRTWQSQSADSRDKLFGILGLLRPRADNSRLGNNASSSRPNKLVPNYQISTRHVFIGLFAHILINLGVTDVLISAAGQAALPGYPSWVPGWQAREPLRGENDIRKTYTAKDHDWKASLCLRRRKLDESDFCTSLFPLSLQYRGREKGGPNSNPYQDWGSAFRSRSVPQHRGRTRREENPKLYDMNSWRRSASIDSSTGALSIKLYHLFRFSASPVKTEGVNYYSGARGLQTVEDMYSVIEEPCALHIMTHKGGASLDTLVPPGRNHLFYLKKEEGDPGYLLLFLQELEREPFLPGKSFKLLLCCAYADIFLVSPREKDALSDVNLDLSLHAAISQAREMIGGKEILESRLYHADRFNTRGWAGGMQQMFPWDKIALIDALRVFQGYLNESRNQKPNFLDAYVQVLNERIPYCHIKVTLDGDGNYNDSRLGWIELTLTPQHWAEYGEHYRSTEFTTTPKAYENEIIWEWSYASAAKGWFERKWMSCRARRWGPWKSGEAMSVRARIKSFIKSMEGTYFYRSLKSLSVATRATATAGTSENELQMLTREPGWDDHFIPCWRWPQALIDSFAADGVPWEVSIF